MPYRLGRFGFGLSYEFKDRFTHGPGYEKTSTVQSVYVNKYKQIIVNHVGMPSVKTSTKHFCNTLKDMNPAVLLYFCLPGLTGNGGIDGLRLSKTSNFHTLAG